MSFQSWINYIKSAKKSSVICNKIRKIHYLFPDGPEMVEEYSMDTGRVIKRVWKKKPTAIDLTGSNFSDWDIELGDVGRSLSGDSNFLVKESVTEPILSKRVTKNNIEWRIRNLPYPLEIYAVTADPEQKCIMVRTTNKKYFTKITVPELERCSLVPDQKCITIGHQHNTLIITYKKPEIVEEMERNVLLILKDVETESLLDEDSE